MKFLCINNDEMDGILTKGREYAGTPYRDFIKIYRCDDKMPGFFELHRFEEVKQDVTPVYEVRINHYFLEVEKK